MYRPLQTLAVMAVASIGLVGAARADMVVLESTVSGFKTGDHVDANSIGSLPPGTYIKVIDQATNATRTFRGPAAADMPFGAVRGLKRNPHP